MVIVIGLHLDQLSAWEPLVAAVACALPYGGLGGLPKYVTRQNMLACCSSAMVARARASPDVRSDHVHPASLIERIHEELRLAVKPEPNADDLWAALVGLEGEVRYEDLFGSLDVDLKPRTFLSESGELLLDPVHHPVYAGGCRHVALR